MPDDSREMRVTVTADTSALASGMARAQAATEKAAAAMKSSFGSVAEATAALKTAQAEMAQVLAQVGGAITEQNAAWGIYSQLQRQAAAAAEYLASAQAAVAASAAQAASAQEGAAASAGEYAGAQRAAAHAAESSAASDEFLNRALTSGTARLLATAGGAGNFGFALGTVAEKSNALVPILSTLFYPAAAVVMAQIAVSIAESFAKWYRNAVELKGVIADLRSLAAQVGGEANSAAYRDIQGRAAVLRAEGHAHAALRVLQRHIGDQPLRIGLKIKQQDLNILQKTLTGVTGPGGPLVPGAYVRSLLNLLQSPTTTLGSAVGDLGKIGAAISAIHGELTGTHVFGYKTIRYLAVLAGGGWGAPFTNVSGYKTIHYLSHQQLAQLKSAEATLIALQSTIKHDASAAQERLDAQSAALARQAATRAARAAHVGPHKVLSPDEQMDAVSLGLANVKTGVPSYADYHAVPTEHLRAALEALARLNQKWAKENAALKQHAANLAKILSTAPPMANLRTGKAIGEQPSLDKQIGVLSGDLLGLGNVKAMNAEMEARVKSIEKLFAGAARTIDRTMDQALQGIVMGTQRVSVAFRRLGADIALSIAEAMAKVLVNWAVAHMEMRAISAATSMKVVAHHAASAAAGAYDAEAGIPVIGPILGAAAAAATFASVMALGAFASAAGGQWEVPHEQMTLLHPREMVLPAQHAEALRQAVSGGRAGREMHFHFSPAIHAVDADGVRDMLDRHQGEFARAAHRWMRAQNA